MEKFSPSGTTSKFIKIQPLSYSDVLLTPYIQSLAHVEAYIDFSEDENIEDDIMDTVRNSLTNLAIEVKVCILM